jgi:hypothetical protein
VNNRVTFKNRLPQSLEQLHAANDQVRIIEVDFAALVHEILEDRLSFGFSHVPEPSTLLLCLIALGVVGGWRKWGG